MILLLPLRSWGRTAKEKIVRRIRDKERVPNHIKLNKKEPTTALSRSKMRIEKDLQNIVEAASSSKEVEQKAENAGAF